MSITKKISIPFFLSFFLIFVTNIWFNKYFEDKIEHYLTKFYIDAASDILFNINDESLLEFSLHKYDLQKIDISKINSGYIVLKHFSHTFGEVNIIKLKDKDNDEDDIFGYIHYLDKKLLIQKNITDISDDRDKINTLLYFAVFVLFVLYLFILKFLSPIKTITKKIEEFSAGKLDTKLDYTSSDEIGKLAQSFNTMADKISFLVSSKDELLRDIGHELQTPIAKCKFALENIENGEDKEIIKNSLIQLQTLITIILRLEHLEQKELKLGTFSVETLLTETLSNILITDESNIEIEIVDNFNITAELFYLSLALKNLIENALKYSTQLPIKIIVSKNKISIKNIGKVLSKELSFYTKAFSRDERSSHIQGYGLGLNIVNKILKKHNFTLSYSYEEKYHIFEIDFPTK